MCLKTLENEHTIPALKKPTDLSRDNCMRQIISTVKAMTELRKLIKILSNIC